MSHHGAANIAPTGMLRYSVTFRGQASDVRYTVYCIWYFRAEWLSIKWESLRKPPMAMQAGNATSVY